MHKEFGYTIYDAGLLSTIFTLGLAVAGIPTGYLLDENVAQGRASNSASGFSRSAPPPSVLAYRRFTDMPLYRAVTGIGEAMQVTVLIAICANHFSKLPLGCGRHAELHLRHRRHRPVLAGFLLSYYQNWRFPMLIFGLLGIVATSIALFVKPWFSETWTPRLPSTTWVMPKSTPISERF